MIPKNSETLKALEDLSPNIPELSSIVHRPPFYGLFVFSVSFSLDIKYFYKFEEHKEFFKGLAKNKKIYIQTDPRLMNFYIFTNDLKFILDILKSHKNDLFEVSELRLYSIKIIEDSQIGKKIKAKQRKEPKKPWYNRFPYRVRFKTDLVQVCNEIDSDLEKFDGDYLWNTNHYDLLYVTDLKDIFLLKLLHSEKIKEIISYNQEDIFANN